MSLLQGEGRWFESIRPYHLRGYISHGEAKRKRRFHIIDCGTYYIVKKRFGPFWFYVREGFNKLTFDDFGDVVRYVNERRKNGM